MLHIQITADINSWVQKYYEDPAGCSVFSDDSVNDKYFNEVKAKSGHNPNTEFCCPYCVGKKHKFLWCIRDEKRGDRQGAMRHLVNMSHRFNEYSHKINEQYGIDINAKRTKKEWFEFYAGYINPDECRCDCCNEQFDTDAELLAHIKKKNHFCSVVESTQTNIITFTKRSIDVFPKITNSQKAEILSYERIVRVKIDSRCEEQIICKKAWVCKCCEANYPKMNIKKITFKRYGDICRHINERYHKKALVNHNHS
jgi:hypothetical protein